MRRVLLAFACLVATGCATMVSGSRQVVTIQGTPPEAVYVIRTAGGVQVNEGVVSSWVPLPRNDTYQIDITLDGYETRTFNLTRSTNGWVFGNLVIFWIIGFAVDYSTGAAYQLEPAAINVELEPGDPEVGVVRFLDGRGRLIRAERFDLVPTGDDR